MTTTNRSTDDVTGDVVVCKWHPDLVAELLREDARVHLVLDRYDDRAGIEETDLLERCTSVHRVGDFDSLEELAAVAVDLRLAGQERPLVVSHNEMSQFGAGYLRLLLGDGAAPLDHVAHRDKRLMKRRVAETGAPVARFASLDPRALDDDAIAAAVSGLTPPLVVKPVAGLGGVNTVEVDGPADLAGAVRKMGADPLVHARGLIVEEFITGYEVAVDALWSGGEEVFLVAHRYHQNRIRITNPTAATLDGSRVLRPDDEPELYRKVRELHALVNPALGIRDCATHMEVFVQPDGHVVFSEVAARAGGAWIPDLLTTWLGRSNWSFIARAALGHPAPQPHHRYRYVASASLHPLESGVLAALPGPGELAAQPGVVRWRYLRHAGERARRHHPSDYYVHLILAADSRDELMERCAAAVRDLPIRTRAA